MGAREKVLERLEELIRMGESVRDSAFARGITGTMLQGLAVRSEDAFQWGVSSLNTLERSFGTSSSYYRVFDGLFSGLENLSTVERGLGVLRAARDDWAHGHIYVIRQLVEAEVFDDFLAQAEYLKSSGYYAPAAVIAGSVLEDGLRKLCSRNQINLDQNPKLDQMNTLLTKQGVYGKLVQKRVTVFADVRNKAAHGKWDEFGPGDVEEVLRGVRHFMATHFGQDT